MELMTEMLFVKGLDNVLVFQWIAAILKRDNVISSPSTILAVKSQKGCLLCLFVLEHP